MKKTVIAYVLKGAGMNKKGVLERMVSEEWHKFSNVYDINYMDEKFKITGGFKKYDYIDTYDGYNIASQKFKNFCDENDYTNLEFIAFPNDNYYYWLKVHNVLTFDAKKKGTMFINYSEKYKGFEEVIRATPAILKYENIINDGIYRTDLFFADGESKHPLIIVGVETKNKIRAAKLMGIIFEEIISSSPQESDS